MVRGWCGLVLLRCVGMEATLLPAVPSSIPASFKTILHCLGFESCVTTSSFTVENSLDYFAFSAHKCACALMNVLN